MCHSGGTGEIGCQPHFDNVTDFHSLDPTPRSTRRSLSSNPPPHSALSPRHSNLSPTSFTNHHILSPHTQPPSPLTTVTLPDNISTSASTPRATKGTKLTLSSQPHSHRPSHTAARRSRHTSQPPSSLSTSSTKRSLRISSIFSLAEVMSMSACPHADGLDMLFDGSQQQGS
eukprot:GHVN01096190.1.p1 GENE.GHVN01096190.1~~GHVN01096190.1.p1  ORF type:complete len:172 (-),score=59.74 GHVN01096190.1:210-725(-)